MMVKIDYELGIWFSRYLHLGFSDQKSLMHVPPMATCHLISAHVHAAGQIGSDEFCAHRNPLAGCLLQFAQAKIF